MGKRDKHKAALPPTPILVSNETGTSCGSSVNSIELSTRVDGPETRFEVASGDAKRTPQRRRRCCCRCTVRRCVCFLFLFAGLCTLGTFAFVEITWGWLWVFCGDEPEKCMKEVCSHADCVAVFYKGLNRVRCYRIPAIVHTHDGTLLAFAEARYGEYPDPCHDQGVHDIVVRRSVDGGATWGPVITIYKGDEAAPPCTGCSPATANPSPVAVRFANGSHAVLVAFTTMNNPNTEKYDTKGKHGQLLSSWSDDDGRTWSSAKPMHFPPEENKGNLLGPSVGLQAADGTIFFQVHPGFLMYSHDDGATWSATARAMPRGIFATECSITFVNASSTPILMDCKGPPYRAQMYWSSNGRGGYYPNQRVDSIEKGRPSPGCQGSVLSRSGVLYASNPASVYPNDRVNLTIRRSDDGGVMWKPKGRLLHDGPSAYSQLVNLGVDGRIGVLFETGRRGRAGGHPYETISFTAIDPP